MNNMMAQIQSWITQEPIHDSLSNRDVLQDSPLSNGSHEVEENKKKGNDLEDEDVVKDEVIEECLQSKNLNAKDDGKLETQVELKENGGKEHLQYGMLEE